MSARVTLLVCSAIALAGCHRDPVEAAAVEEGDMPYVLDLPPGAPEVELPPGVPFTHASVALGKALFFEPRLSMGNDISCASCHHPERAFSDTLAFSRGAGGGIGFRNAPSLANVAYHPLLSRDGGVPSLELQVLVPLHDEHEMASNINDAALALRDVEPYRSLALKAYGRALDPYVITRALASYERTLISGTSRFDRWVYSHEQSALTPAELRGWAVFTSPGVNCIACHSGFDLSDHGFHNVGLTLDHTADPGRERITLDPADRGKFKTPTLRNIALTAPYMHDGSLATLEEVIDHFAGGGLNDPNKSPLVHSFELTDQERQDLLALLRSFTDGRTLDQVP